MDIEWHHRIEITGEVKAELYDAYLRHDFDEFNYNLVAVVILARIDGEIIS